MALSSLSGRCFFCMGRTEDFMRGWRLRNGSTAALCIRCGSDYLNGKLCETFHIGQDGWVNCTLCSKPLHITHHLYTELDFGGVGCSDCFNEFIIQSAAGASNRRYPAPTPAPSPAPASASAPSPASASAPSPASTPAYAPASASAPSPVSASAPSPVSASAPAYAPASASAPSPVSASAPAYAPASASAPSPASAPAPSPASAPATDGEDVSSQIPRVDAATESHLHPQNLPRTTSNEQQLPEISGNSSSEVILLFEKTITATDTHHNNARLIIPKREAEAHFPAIREKQRLPIAMRDSTGREWRFTYVCWRNGMTVMYVLEGLNGYMLINQWRAGDKVAFHRIVSEGKLQIRTIKAASSDPPAPAKEQSPIDKNQV